MEEFTAITNDRGLYKKILKEGTGNPPSRGTNVTVSYKGILEDGTPFDENDTFTFVLGGGAVINGWEVGIGTMRKGEKSILVMRCDYGYGEDGYMIIPPGATLIYMIDLLEFSR